MTDYAELFTLTPGQAGYSTYRTYEWLNYRIQWDNDYDVGDLYVFRDSRWVLLTHAVNNLSFRQLARMAWEMERDANS